MSGAAVADPPLYWRRYGQGDKTAVALHCSLAHSGKFAGLAAALPEFGLIAPDLPGHGRSADWSGRGDYHSETTRDVLAMLAQLDLGAVPLIGHSFGATVALRVALERPEAVSALVLIEPVLFCAARAAGGPSFAVHLAAHAGFAAARRVGDLHKAAAAFQAIWGAGLAFDALPEAQQDYISARTPLVAATNPVLNDDAAGMLVYGRLESLGVPVLLVQGDQSPPIIDAIHTELARRLPQVQRAQVVGAGHMLPVTHPRDCAALIRAFLSP
ncbi:alpha/beta fold hydrolase [Pseudotabrizicola sp.]|uniref:alpha/beta fold hydrolase n=1 Tax=Pseudotabrizicola sp. TaxID=2939647 RepID=UPI002718A4EF|nr:alpha/beta hydrolase [Pseudotabrizicola sp.]MDO8884511.1 alpha/beta hydrolase [Pseudotabrizicola sp.]